MKKQYQITILTIFITLCLNLVAKAQCGPNKTAMHICTNNKCQGQCVPNNQVYYYQVLGYILGKCEKNSCFGPMAIKEDSVIIENVLSENTTQELSNTADSKSSIWQIEESSEFIQIKKTQNQVVQDKGGSHCTQPNYGCRPNDLFFYNKCRNFCSLEVYNLIRQ